MRLLRTLRGRLVLVLAGVSLTGLVVMGVTSVTLLHHSLMSRVDERLAEMSHPWEGGHQPPPPPPGDYKRTAVMPTDFRVVFFDPSGHETGILGQSGQQQGGPMLNPLHVPRVATVPDRNGGSDWRVRTSVLPSGELIALALPLSSVDTTVHQLVVIELLVGGGVLLGLAAAATLTVRFGLRPLTRIEHTADTIAAGNLHRRVPDQDPRTETGRLGAALNTMLERLVEALEQREQSEQRLRLFVADASHELRTPLTSIRGFAELYRRSDRPREEDVRRMMRRIESEAARMGDLVEDLLLLARLDRERTIERVEVDLVPLVQDILHDGRARDPDREITLQAPESPLAALADSARLRQVLTNLLNNALLHSAPSAPITVEVSRGRRGVEVMASAGASLLPATPVAVVSIADGGPGISPDHARRIFDRFYRVDPARSNGRTGLGLAIAVAIAEAHHGRIELHANPRGGSTFRLLLPLS